MDATILHLLQFMIKFGVRDEDVQSVGVHTHFKDSGTLQPLPFRFFFVQLTANRPIKRLLRWSKEWPNTWTNPHIEFMTLHSPN